MRAGSLALQVPYARLPPRQAPLDKLARRCAPRAGSPHRCILWVTAGGSTCERWDTLPCGAAWHTGTCRVHVTPVALFGTNARAHVEAHTCFQSQPSMDSHSRLGRRRLRRRLRMPRARAQPPAPDQHSNGWSSVCLRQQLKLWSVFAFDMRSLPFVTGRVLLATGRSRGRRSHHSSAALLRCPVRRKMPCLKTVEKGSVLPIEFVESLRYPS